MFDEMFGIQVDGSSIGWFDNGDWLRYNSIDFGNGISTFKMNAAVDPNHAGQTMDLRVDTLDGPVIGTITFWNTGSWSTFQQQSTGITGTIGIHDLYLVGAGGDGIGNIDWFTFE